MFVARAHCSFIQSKSPGFFVGITKHSSSPSSSAPRRREGVRRPPLQVEAGGQANDAAANDADAHDGAALKFLGGLVLFRNLFRDFKVQLGTGFLYLMEKGNRYVQNKRGEKGINILRMI